MRIKLLAFIFCSFIAQNVIGQQTITGTITATDNIPVPGVNVIIKGTSTGTATDFDGNFSIEANKGDVLVISYLGFVTKEIVVSDTQVYTIVLEEDLNQLDEVVIVGYGTQKKAVLTSSVSSIKGEELAKEPITNATQALQGKAAGVQIVASDAPGAASTVIIRGLGTIQGGRNPLYVVDGVLTDNINNINTSDIKTLNVLKDAASLAIYGNRGANGVVIVTTKKGKSGKMQLTFDTYTGVKDISYKVDMADAASFVTYSNEALLRDLRNDDDPTNDNDISSFFPTNQQYNTNWLDAITRIGRVSNYNFSLSGGSEDIQAFFSVGFNKEEGILKDNDYNRLTLRSNVDYKISEKFNFSHQVSVQLASFTPKNFGAFTTAYKQSPIVPVKDENGQFGSILGRNNVGNPVQDLFFQDEEQKYFKLQGSFKVDYKIIESLVFTSQFSIETNKNREYNFQNLLGKYASTFGNTEAGYQPADPAQPLNPLTTLTVKHINNYHWFLDNYVTFDKTFGENHNVKATIGITSDERGGEFLEGSRWNVPTDSNLKFNLNTGDDDTNKSSNGTFDVLEKLSSYIARVNYDYKNTYLFNASFRRDGSSKFQQGKRWGNFFAVSAGWVLTNESFMENSIFNKLKLRASYGELGNQNVAANLVNAKTGNYEFGGNIQQFVTIQSVIDQDLSWERTNEIDVGVEFTLFDHRLDGEVDYYKRVNENVILGLELPDIFGLDPFNFHVGEIENTGVEVQLNWADNINDNLKYHIGTNFSYNKNELTKSNSPFFNEQQGGDINNGQFTKKVTVGQPIGSFFLYEVDGIDDRGEFVYKDLDNDGIITEEDRRYFGSYIPEISLGFNFGFDYKSFDFNVDTFGNFGNKVYNGKKAQRFANENIEQDIFNNRWTSGRHSNTTPIAFNQVPLSSNYYLESGDFFRINNITLGYTLPNENLGIFSKIRIYASVKNPIILKRFSGYTPELPGNPLGTAGIELDAYPTLRSFFIGTNISF